ncbi:MAG: hypothetical protein EOO68_07165 [Moraxellaceae bacterium]|nr:MAG: hypothetical protein EOO68_07165 [Moraxellaceae bacterium]
MSAINLNRHKANWPLCHIGFTATEIGLKILSVELQLSVEQQLSVSQQAIDAEQTEPCLIRIARYATILPASCWTWPKSRWLYLFRQQGVQFLNLGNVIISHHSQQVISYFFETSTKNGQLTQIVYRQTIAGA